MIARACLLFSFAVLLAACAVGGRGGQADLPPAPAPESAPSPVEAPSAAASVDFVLVRKSARQLVLFADGRAIRTYAGIQLGDAPVGPKHFEGDERTPEGRYRIDYRNPHSAYHLSLHISYPDAQDRAFASARGYSPGGAIFIHGQPNSLPFGRVPGDWTAGCIAVSDSEIEELWQTIPDGTPIEIRP